MVKALSLNEIRHRANGFVIDWKGSPGDERQEAQSFVRDLLKVYGLTETRAASYEKRAKRSSTAGAGYIDALVPGQLLIEMKSAGRDLGQAERQALDYIDDLADAEQPKYVLTCDFKNFRLLDISAPDDTDTTVWELEEFALYVESLSFLAGYHTRAFGSKEQERASVQAAQLMAKLYESLEGSGLGDHDAGIFLVRTLFALYADDSGVWERDLFTEFLETRTSNDGTDLGSQMVGLFQIMNTPLEQRSSSLDELLARFPYVNGGIFDGAISIPYFNKAVRDQLIDAAAFDWREISPAIFGSLFQAVKSPQARRSLGEHYTTETNIRKTLGPLFLDELHERFATSQHDIKGLKKLRADLAEIRVLDPACGSGNFLIVAYRELRQLELSILLRLQELGDTSAIPTLFFQRADLAVRLEHMAGIEIEEWPAQIARTALRLVDHQANMSMEAALGKAPATLPLDTIDVITVGNALMINWASVVAPSTRLYVLGNPPFLGDNTRDKEQKAQLMHAWGGNKILSRMDYVTGWHAKALDLYSRPGYDGQWAFVTTNSITQGDQVPRLFEPIFNHGWQIKFAHQTFAWSSEAPKAAAVHCVIIGFIHEYEARKNRIKQRLFTYPNVKGKATEVPVTRSINAYLLDADNVLVEKRSTMLSPILSKTWRGSMPSDGGHLIIEPSEHDEFMADPVAAKYVHPYVGAKELLHGKQRWCLWLDGMDPADLNRSKLLKQRVEAVKEFRSNSDAASTRNYPHHHLFRQLAKQDEPYVCIPRHVSETRNYFTVARFGPDTIAGDANFTVVDPNGLQFAAMSSSMFITWQKAIGGRIKSDLRFASTLTWYTFPFPAVDEKPRDQIIEAGRGVLEARSLHPERSLADHYNPLAMDPALLKAHAKLDRVVDKAFGAKRAITTPEQRLQLLFDRYPELTKSQA